MFRQCFIAVLLPIAFSFITLNIVSSQSGQSGQFGMITGTVKDPNGGVVAGAQIPIRSEVPGVMRDAVTGNNVQFKVDALAPCGYKVTVKLNGFKTVERDIKIESGIANTIEIKLELAEIVVESTVATKGSITPNADPN